VCATCEVQNTCLEFAIATNQEYGVWGGTSEEERRVLRRAWRAGQRRCAS
jgi:WhiB family redox-sensing transcriptional regulator